MNMNWKAESNLSSLEKFNLLVLNVPYDQATFSPPLCPSNTENVSVDKGAAGEDWVHTTTAPWHLVKTCHRVFRPSPNYPHAYIHRDLSKRDLSTLTGTGYVMTAKYFNSSKNTEIKRKITEVTKFNASGSNGEETKMEETNYALVQYNFLHQQSLSPKKRKGSDKNNNSLTALSSTHINEIVETAYGQYNFTHELEQKKCSDNNNNPLPVTALSPTHTNEIEFPEFEKSYLPEFFRATWNNARVIVERNLVKDHPLCNKTIVASLSSTEKFYNISYSKFKFSCECEGFCSKNVCSHIIAAAFKAGKLEKFLADFEMPSIKETISSKTIEEKAGKKTGFQRRLCTAYKRNVQGFFVPEEYFTDNTQDLCYLIFVQDTRATKCYGCGGHLRGTGTVAGPRPPPFDIVIQSKTYRHLRERSTKENPGKLHIKTQKENVYFHSQLPCLPFTKSEILKRLIISENVKVRLLPLHHKMLFSEFGFLL